MAQIDLEQLELIRQARTGDAERLATLAGVVRQRAYAYIHRVTLEPDTAQDLAQDTVVSVLGSLDKLEQVERFWPWVFRIATNKVRQYYRESARHRTVQMPDEQVCPAPDTGRLAGVAADVVQSELAELTRSALAGVSERHRTVLMLRYFEDMPHSEIARILDCSELATRAALFRAKHAVAHELKRRGVTKALLGCSLLGDDDVDRPKRLPRGSLLAAALLAFGEATVFPHSAAAVSISASAVAESSVAVLLSAKAKAAAAVAASLLIVCGVAWWSPTAGSSSSGAPVRWVHFSRHSAQAISNPVKGIMENQSQGIYEQWYHFPEGVGGPMFFRMQRWTPDGRNKQCWWIENGDANYYIHSGEKKIHLHNDHIISGSTMTKCLPTDSMAMAEFIRGVEGEKSGALLNQAALAYQRDPQTGFVVSHDDTRFPELGKHHATYEYRDLDMSLFASPTGMEVVDERDVMHKRGWTYFQVGGVLDGRKVEGFGCLPLVYNAGKQHPAWVKLMVDGRLAAADNGEVAYRLDADGKVTAAQPGGSLFRAMARPWTGVHTIDVIRRDAASERIWYSTDQVDEDALGTVTLIDDRAQVQYMLRYTVDMPRDVLERIEIWRGPQGIFQERVGELVFKYDDRMTQPISGASKPQAAAVSESVRKDAATVLWPLQLLRPTASQVASAR